jgi:acyl-CoA thioesterase
MILQSAVINKNQNRVLKLYKGSVIKPRTSFTQAAARKYNVPKPHRLYTDEEIMQEILRNKQGTKENIKSAKEYIKANEM